jgi:hypothetical protein
MPGVGMGMRGLEKRRANNNNNNNDDNFVSAKKLLFGAGGQVVVTVYRELRSVKAPPGGAARH